MQLALPRPVENLSDGESEVPAGFESDRGEPDGGEISPKMKSDDDDARAMQALRKRLSGVCSCMRRRAQGAAKRVRARDKDCFRDLRTVLPDVWASCRAFTNLHKLDQDKMLYDMIRGAASLNMSGQPSYNQNVRYSVSGREVCLQAFCAVWGIGDHRLATIRKAALAGTGPPVDLRYLAKGRGGKDSPALSQVTSFLSEIYESEAETLAEVDGWDANDWFEELQLVAGEDCGALELVVPPGAAVEALPSDIKFLPPGTVSEYWKQFCHVYPEIACSYRYFREVWKRDWRCLKFRNVGQHSICSTCLSHKMLIQSFGSDVVQRTVALDAFHAHKADQYKDRRVYWRIRADARLAATAQQASTISIIIDGMDQAKFAYPRHPAMQAKSLESLERPRLHVNGMLIHGVSSLVTMSRPDMPKDTNFTCELIMHALTMIMRQHGQRQLAEAHLHVQLDNTSSCNKNNILLRFLAFITAKCMVTSATCNFLRKGHTHEDIDQYFGQVAKRIKSSSILETPAQFCECVGKWMASLPGEQRGVCVQVDRTLDWKSWLESLFHLRRHTGPLAPHTFRFERRCTAEPVLRSTGLDEHPATPAPHPDDVVLFCKHYMASPCFSQRPFVALPFSYAAPLFETAPPVSQRRAQDALTVHKISNIKKHVPVLRQPGFRVDAGAAELEAWAEHRLEPLPLLDTRAIRSPCQACGGDALMPGSVGASMQGVREEEVAAVGHAKASGARVDALPPSVQTRVVYACAASLFNNHGFPLADAIRVGEECWARVNPSAVRRVAEDLECGSDAEV